MDRLLYAAAGALAALAAVVIVRQDDDLTDHESRIKSLEDAKRDLYERDRTIFGHRHLAPALPGHPREDTSRPVVP